MSFSPIRINHFCFNYLQPRNKWTYLFNCKAAAQHISGSWNFTLVHWGFLWFLTFQPTTTKKTRLYKLISYSACRRSACQLLSMRNRQALEKKEEFLIFLQKVWSLFLWPRTARNRKTSWYCLAVCGFSYNFCLKMFVSALLVEEMLLLHPSFIQSNTLCFIIYPSVCCRCHHFLLLCNKTKPLLTAHGLQLL